MSMYEHPFLHKKILYHIEFLIDAKHIEFETMWKEIGEKFKLSDYKDRMIRESHCCLNRNIALIMPIQQHGFIFCLHLSFCLR